MKKLISTVGLLLFAAMSTLSLQTAHEASAQEGGSQDQSAPDVITTLTDEEVQKRDRLRPKYLQPAEGKSEPISLPFEPRSGESLVFIGNSLAERMEHHNFFEASLQQTFADKQITFRNMGFPGHTPAFRPEACLLYTSPSPRDQRGSRMPSSA